MNWSINKSNIVPLLALVFVVPSIIHACVKDELAIRETKLGVPVRDRV
jgi:hypothetical protein